MRMIGCSVSSRYSTSDSLKEESIPKFRNSWFSQDNIVTCSVMTVQLFGFQVLVEHKFHEFLKLETKIGNISRQDTIIMVPPFFLDVHPDYFVLDVCATLGSKPFSSLLVRLVYCRNDEDNGLE